MAGMQTPEGTPASGSQGGPGMRQEPTHLWMGTQQHLAGASSHSCTPFFITGPTSHPRLPGSWQRREGRPTRCPGISLQPLYLLEPTPYRSRWEGRDLNSHCAEGSRRPERLCHWPKAHSKGGRGRARPQLRASGTQQLDLALQYHILDFLESLRICKSCTSHFSHFPASSLALHLPHLATR